MLSWLSSCSPNYAALVCGITAPILFLGLLAAVGISVEIASGLIPNRPSED